MSILFELPCYFNCAQQSGYFNTILTLVLLSITLFALRTIIKSPTSRLLTFTISQITALAALIILFLSLTCKTPMYAMIIYSAYVLSLTTLTIIFPRFYDKILIRHLKARPITQLMSWPQQFLDSLSSNKQLYWYDSAMPKAFASGRTIFLSLGLLEVLNEYELRAVIAHETWHLAHNSKTPLLKQLSLMTFINPRNCQQDLEKLADEYAARMAGREALASAHEKLTAL